MIYFPSCKINLGLHILRKREDGYHEIATGMLEIPFRDVLEVQRAAAFSFTTSGLTIPGTGNICVDAFRLLQLEYDLPEIHLHLHKLIPMGGGLGGGSSDGAQTLIAVNRLFDLQLTDAQLECYAAQLGSDCPFFIKGGLQLAEGRGEVLRPLDLDLPNWHICVVNPGIHVPTKDAYAQVMPNSDRPDLEAILRGPVSDWKTQLVNDFEASVFAQYPILADLKQDLYAAGAVYAAMSGSGSTLFGLFEQQPETIRWSQPPVYEVWV